MTTLSGEEPLNLGIHPLLECDPKSSIAALNRFR
jgi:hypothetical protein